MSIPVEWDRKITSFPDLPLSLCLVYYTEAEESLFSFCVTCILNTNLTAKLEKSSE